MVYSKKRTLKWIRNRLDELKDRQKVYANEQFILVFGFVEKILRRTFIELLRRKGVPDAWAQTISLKTNIPGLGPVSFPTGPPIWMGLPYWSNCKATCGWALA